MNEDTRCEDEDCCELPVEEKRTWQAVEDIAEIRRFIARSDNNEATSETVDNLLHDAMQRLLGANENDPREWKNK